MSEITTAVEAKDTDQEVAALVRQLHDTQRRLQELAGGEWDTVLHSGSPSFPPSEAQERWRKSESAQRELAATQSSILNALPAHVALLDRRGVILSVNDGWRDFAVLQGRQESGARVGSNYLAACDGAVGDCSEQGKAEAAGIRSVLNRGLTHFSMEYPCQVGPEKYWFRLMVNSMARDDTDGVVVMHINITDRRLGEENLAASEALLRQFIRHAPAAIAMLDRQMHYIQTSERWIQDYHLAGQEIIGRSHYDVFPDLPPHWKAMHQRVLAGAIERCDEEPFPRADGSMEWLQWEARPWHRAGGEIGGIIFFTQVITAQKRAQESLILFRTLIDQSGDAIEVLDAETLGFLDFNESACVRLGYTRQELLGMSVADIDQEVNPVLWAKRGQLLRATGAITFEARHERKDGSSFPVEVSLKRVQLERCYVVAAVRDITERRRTEARFSRLVSSNVQGVIFWNTSGALTVANDAFLRLVRRTRSDFEAGRLNWVQMTPPEYAHLDNKALAEIAATGVCAAYEKELSCGDGSRVSVLLGAAAFEDNPSEGVCFFIDLTERKELEMQFLRAQRMESIGTLAGGIAHDLNNTLSPIIMSLDILAKKFTDPESEQLLEILASSARRGANMVRQVLSFARGVESERTEMQIKHLVHEIENIVRDTFPKNVQMSCGVANDLWTILGDATQLHQVLLNLCVNARDAMPGGGKIQLSAENVTLDAPEAGMNPDAHPGSYICLRVQDSGTGISPGNIAKIFDPFFTTKPMDQGTGLGLSTTAAIVKSHGGFVRVQSELGTGTEFKIYLPALAEAQSAGRPGRVVEMPRGHDELILVVDDEEAIRVITKQTLEAFGYRAIVANDGADALAIYARRHAEVDAVLTDLMMPVLDGLAIIPVLRRINPELPIIAASGLSTEGHMAQAATLGVQHFLNKPYSSETLLTTLSQALPKKVCNGLTTASCKQGIDRAANPLGGEA